jgi:hypothetical protein
MQLSHLPYLIAFIFFPLLHISLLYTYSSHLLFVVSLIFSPFSPSLSLSSLLNASLIFSKSFYSSLRLSPFLSLITSLKSPPRRLSLLLLIFLLFTRGQILGRNPDRSLKSFPSCYSQSPLKLCLEISISSSPRNLLQFL